MFCRSHTQWLVPLLGLILASTVFAVITPLGSIYPNFSNVFPMSIDNDRVYTVDYNGISIVDVSSPLQPRIEGYIPGNRFVTWLPDAIRVEDDHLYMLSGYDSLKIYNISDWNHPQHVGTYRTQNPFYPTPNMLSVSGSLLIIAGETTSELVSVIDPTRPRLVATLPSAEYAEIDGNRFVLASMTNLSMYSLAERAIPELKFSHPISGTRQFRNNFAFSRDYLFAILSHSYGVSEFDTLLCFDLRITQRPPKPLRINLGGLTQGNQFLAASDDRVAVRVRGEVKEYRTPYEWEPQVFQQVRTMQSFDDYYCNLQYDSNLLYTVSGNSLSINNYATTVTTFTRPGRLYNPVLHNGYIYLPDYSGGLIIAQEMPTGGVQVVSQFNPAATFTATDITFRGDIAFIADDWYGLISADMRDPIRPVLLDTADNWSQSMPLKILLQDNRAYVPGYFS